MSAEPAASLGERIDARGPNDPHGPMAGILIYSAAPDVEVKHGNPTTD